MVKMKHIDASGRATLTNGHHIRTRFPKKWNRRYPVKMEWKDTLCEVNKVYDRWTAREFAQNVQANGVFVEDIGGFKFSEMDSDYCEFCRKYFWQLHFRAEEQGNHDLARYYREHAEGLQMYLDELDAENPAVPAERGEGTRDRQAGWQYASRERKAQFLAERERDDSNGIVYVDTSFHSNDLPGLTDPTMAVRFAEQEPMDWKPKFSQLLRLESFQGQRTLYAGTASKSWDALILDIWTWLTETLVIVRSGELTPDGKDVQSIKRELAELIRWMPKKEWGKVSHYGKQVNQHEDGTTTVKPLYWSIALKRELPGLIIDLSGELAAYDRPAVLGEIDENRLAEFADVFAQEEEVRTSRRQAKERLRRAKRKTRIANRKARFSAMS